MEKPTEFSTSMAFVDRPLAKVHKFYLSGEIKAPSEYVGVFDNPEVSSVPELKEALLQGKTSAMVLEQIELKYCSIG